MLIFNAVEIRDTNTNTSDLLDAQDWSKKTIVIENRLDRAITLQCKASAYSDFSHSFNVGISFSVEANTISYQTCDSFFPYFKMTAKCDTSPTSGYFSVDVLLFSRSV